MAVGANKIFLSFPFCFPIAKIERTAALVYRSFYTNYHRIFNVAYRLKN